MRYGASIPRVGDYNEKVVLHAIRPSGGISQTELVELTGLANQTVSQIVNQLLAKGEIRTTGVRSVGRGRPRVIVEIVPTARFSLGVHVDPSVVTLVVLDLAGRVVASSRVTDLDQDPAVATAGIADAARALLAASGAEPSRVLGACVATPGAVDAALGAMVDPLWMPTWDRFPLRDRLTDLLGMPVAFVKDTVAAVTGETWLRGGAADTTTLVFLYLGTGTGVGIAIAGEAMTGVSGNGGEIGRLLVTLGGAGPDDAFAGRGLDNDPAILVARALAAGMLQPDVDATTVGGVDDGFRRLCAAAAAGEPGPRRMLHEAGRRVATAAAVVAEIVDAGEVVLGGPYWHLVHEIYLPECRRALAALGGDVRHPVPVTGSSMGEDVGAIGAAARVLDGHYVPRVATLAAPAR